MLKRYLQTLILIILIWNGLNASINLYSTCPGGYGLTQGNDPSNPNYTGFQFYEASNYVTSSRIVTGGVGTDVTYKADNKVVLTTGFHAKEDNLFRAILGPCTGSTMPDGFIKVTGTFEK